MSHDEAPRTPSQLVVFLRALVGQPEEQPSPTKLAASVAQLLPEELRKVEIGGLIAWFIIGLGFLAEGPPSLKQIRVESWRLIMAIAMLKSGGSISYGATLLDTSRRSLRDGLRAAGLYPWPRRQRARRVDQADDPEPGQESSFASLVRQLSDVVEDGTHGIVWFASVDRNDVGPAWLERGGQSLQLFRGWWVDRETAETYARDYGHDFRCEDEGPLSDGRDERVPGSDPELNELDGCSW